MNLRGEKEPPEGFTKERVPLCSAGYEMVYWGYDAKRKELKYRCPHVCGKVDCVQGSQWCSASNYGMVKKYKLKKTCETARQRRVTRSAGSRYTINEHRSSDSFP